MTTALIVLTAIGATLFVFTYALTAPFYRSEEGWNVMAFMAVVAAMVAQAVYVRTVGHRLPEWVARADWAAACACVWWRLTILVRGQWHNVTGAGRHQASRTEGQEKGVPTGTPEN